MKPTVVPSIILSEKIIREAGTGKLSIINAFQKFIGPTFPFVVPPFAVTVSINQFTGKLDKLKLALAIQDEAGKDIVPAVEAEVGTEAEVSPDEIFEFSFPIPPCEFTAPGNYQVIFRVGNEVAGKRTLPILQASGPVPQANPSPANAGPGAQKKS
jgi:hypothetical protein